MVFTFKIGRKPSGLLEHEQKQKWKTSTATLNLSELVNDEWVNKSKEKLIDTQKKL